jgi:hypothetical protein
MPYLATILNPRMGMAMFHSHQHTYCKIFHHKRMKTSKQSNQSHPPFFIQVTFQGDCHFILIVITSIMHLVNPRLFQ